MCTAITDRLQERIQPLVENANALEIVDLIRAGANSRISGGKGSSDLGQQLYEEIRTGITEDLALLDADGSVATAVKDAPDLLPHNEAWIPAPSLGPQLR
jgi:hypothetical protein